MALDNYKQNAIVYAWINKLLLLSNYLLMIKDDIQSHVKGMNHHSILFRNNAHIHGSLRLIMKELLIKNLSMQYNIILPLLLLIK